MAEPADVALPSRQVQDAKCPIKDPEMEINEDGPNSERKQLTVQTTKLPRMESQEGVSRSPYPLAPTLAPVDLTWKSSQEKTFVRWINAKLSDRKLAIQDLKDSLKDGLILIALYEVLTGKSFPFRYLRKAERQIHRRENLHWALKAFGEHGVRLLNVSNTGVNFYISSMETLNW
eukprot:937618_1